MKILRKHIECGEYSFDIAVDRDIAVRTMEAFPDLCEYMFTKARESAGKIEAKTDDFQFLMDSIHKKELHKLYEQERNYEEFIKYAFPLMLKKAGSDLDAKEIINYVYENGVDTEFNTALYEFILMGFTQGEVTKKKKVNFSIT